MTTDQKLQAIMDEQERQAKVLTAVSITSALTTGLIIGIVFSAVVIVLSF